MSRRPLNRWSSEAKATAVRSNNRHSSRIARYRFEAAVLTPSCFFKTIRRLLVLLSLAVTTGAAIGQQDSASERVEITGRVHGDDRRDASAAKFVLTREEILRFGDTNLGDVLQRIPSITVVSIGTQSREIRLRGLGNGYTQIMIDGQPLARGTSIDSLSPDMIERIEVIRSTSADMSAQAIAGTINILLRRAAATDQREFNLGVATQAGVPSGSSTLGSTWRDGRLTYSGTAALKADRKQWLSVTDLGTQHTTLEALSLQQGHANISSSRTSVALAPRISWQPQDEQTLVIDSLLQFERFTVDSREIWRNVSGEALFFPITWTGIRRDTTEGRAAFNWKTPINNDGRLDLKFVISASRRSSDSEVSNKNELDREVLSRDVVAGVKNLSSGLSGSYSSMLTDDHTIKFGWDGEFSHRSESRGQREISEVGLQTVDLDEAYSAEIKRLALFLQDDWMPMPGLSVYLGLRWETLQTVTRGGFLVGASHRSSTASPSLQLLWKVPGSKSDQFRFNLSRSYKSPTARELIPRRWVETANSATTPNFQGNPDLRPELAWGVDFGYEHYASDATFFGFSGYFRSIDNVVRDRLFNVDGTWLTTPTNGDKAISAGVEIEAKGTIALDFAKAPSMGYRLGFTRNWSRVQDVPGPNNRLREQPILTATLGIDAELPSKAFGIGGSFAFERYGFVRTSSTESGSQDNRRILDLYCVWRLAKWGRLRGTIANILAQDDVVRSSYSDADLRQDQNVRSRSSRSLRLLFESKW
jgi:outer membrane receptor for ferrienterochelin and colicins